MEIDKRISQANGRLKAALIKVAIERRGGTLSLRATLPAREPSQKACRQKISLGVKATPAGLQFAERRARELANDLDAGRFAWEDWLKDDGDDSEPLSCSKWVERFEKDYWSKHDRNPQSEVTWRKDYKTTFNKLPGDEVLTSELLVKVIEKVPADTRTRRRTVQSLSRLAIFAGLPVSFKDMIGSYSPKRVNPRFLPSDGLIAQTRDELKEAGWQWVLGMMACYGLRPHEVFLADLSEFPVVVVPDTNKTRTERFVYPLYPEWAELWHLGDCQLPPFKDLASNDVMGMRVSKAFRQRELPFKPYDLRHCYARRCFEFSLSPDLASGLMGHSIQVHIQTYRAWIDRGTYRRAYDALIHRGDRPLPPEFSLPNGKPLELPVTHSQRLN